MSHVFHRHTRAQLPVAAGGDGPYVIDSNGKRYLDASGGAAVSCLGHSNREVADAIKHQVDKIAYAHTSFFTSEPAEALADLLIDLAPGDMERVYFVSGGSEAMEASLKLARQYWLERGQPEKKVFIARRQSYHGNTLGALAVGGNAWRRAQFAPLLMDTHHIAPCYPYRDRRPDESEMDYGQRVANELETAIEEIGADQVIAFVAETVVGATSGVLVPVPGYFQRVREICDHHGILLILDEVMCGMGRTGSRFACEQENIHGDIIAIAKGLGAGYQPAGAMVVSKEIYTTIQEGSGFFQHGHTYMGHPTTAAAALAVQNIVSRDNLMDNVRAMGASIMDGLGQRLGEHPNVGDIRGRGLFIGIELVSDRETKTPFDPTVPLHTRIKQTAMESGLMCYPMSGTIDGQHGHHILLAPPFIIDDSHVEEIVSKLGDAVESVTGDL